MWNKGDLTWEHEQANNSTNQAKIVNVIETLWLYLRTLKDTFVGTLTDPHRALNVDISLVDVCTQARQWGAWFPIMRARLLTARATRI